MGLKAVRAHARATRGGSEDAQTFLSKLLVEDYAQTKALYDELDEEGQAAADAALGAELAHAFKDDVSLCSLWISS